MKISAVSRPFSVAASAVACLVLAASSQAALRYQSVTDMQTEGQPPQRTVTEAWVEGDKARIEFKDSANPMAPTGTYAVTQDGGATMFLVDPEKETYSEWNVDQLLATAGALMEGMSGMIDLEISDLEVEKLVEEPGPSLHGYSTTHHRYRTRYTMTMRIMGMSRPSTVERLQDFWSTRQLDDLAFTAWLQKTPRTGFEDIDELIAAEMSKVEGVPLKMEETAVTSGKKGKNQARTETSMEVTEIERGVSVAASHFEVPDGYTRTEMITGEPASEEEEGSRNPFRRILGGGR